MEKTGFLWKWKNLKKDQLLIPLLAGVLLLVIAIPHGESTASKTDETESLPKQEGTDTVAMMEEKLARILQQVEGVGKVQVMITLKSSGSKTVEKDHTLSEDRDEDENGEAVTKRSEETTVFSRRGQGSETPFVTEETMPRVEGVLVAAEGGDNVVVMQSISEAVMVLFGVEAHKIKIMKLSPGGRE